MQKILIPIVWAVIGVSLVIGVHVVMNRAVYQQLSLKEPDVQLVTPRGWHEVPVKDLPDGVILKRLAAPRRDDIWVQMVLAGPASSTTADQALDQLLQSYSQLPVKADAKRVTIRSVGMIRAQVDVQDPVLEFDRPVLGSRFHVLAVGHVRVKDAAKWQPVITKILAGVTAS